MNKQTAYSPEILELLSDREVRLVWEREGLLGDFALAVEDAMKERGLSRAALARGIGISPQAISRALSGSQNLTVTTMLQIAMEFGNTLKIKMDPMEDLTKSSNPVTIPLLNPHYSAAPATSSPYVGFTYGESPKERLK